MSSKKPTKEELEGELAGVRLQKRIAEEQNKLDKEKRQRIEDWVGFIVHKLVGVGTAVVSVSEFIDPDLLPIVLQDPLLTLGAGLGLLVGRKVIDPLARIIETLRRDDK